MGRLNSLADVLTDWEELLEAVRRSPDLLPDIEEDIALLARLLAQTRALKARQNELAALRQEATQRLNEEMGRGKETAIRMRSVIRGTLGPRNERLVQFGIAPLRKRRRTVRSRPPERPQGDEGSGNDPRQTPDAGVETRAGVVAVERLESPGSYSGESPGTYSGLSLVSLVSPPGLVSRARMRRWEEGLPSSLSPMAYPGRECRLPVFNGVLETGKAAFPPQNEALEGGKTAFPVSGSSLETGKTAFPPRTRRQEEGRRHSLLRMSHLKKGRWPSLLR